MGWFRYPWVLVSPVTHHSSLASKTLWNNIPPIIFFVFTIFQLPHQVEKPPASIFHLISNRTHVDGYNPTLTPTVGGPSIPRLGEMDALIFILRHFLNALNLLPYRFPKMALHLADVERIQAKGPMVQGSKGWLVAASCVFDDTNFWTHCRIKGMKSSVFASVTPSRNQKTPEETKKTKKNKKQCRRITKDP